MLIKYLNWDTEFFGIKIGKAIIDNDTNFDALEFKKEALDEKYELVYLFSLSKMLKSETVVKADLELIDIMLTMSKKFDKNEYKNYPYKFRTELDEKELKECYYIAEQTAVVSRFYKEEKIGAEKTRSLYRKWIDNAINETYCDGLFLEKDTASGSVTGIHVIKTDKFNKVGYCSMIGVNPKFQGKGQGKKLWKQAFGYWANEAVINSCKVSFSLKNINSFNFHLKMGFKNNEDIKYIYHFKSRIKDGIITFK